VETTVSPLGRKEELLPKTEACVPEEGSLQEEELQVPPYLKRKFSGSTR